MIFDQIDQNGNSPDGVTFDIPYEGKFLNCRVQPKENGHFLLTYNGGKIEYENKQKLFTALNFGGLEQEITWKALKEHGVSYQRYEKVMGEVEDFKADEDETSHAVSFNLDWPGRDPKVKLVIRDFGYISYTIERDNVGTNGENERRGMANNLHDLAFQLRHIQKWSEKAEHKTIVDAQSRAEIAYDTITNPLFFKQNRPSIGEVVAFTLTDNEVVKMDLDWGKNGRTSVNLWVNSGDKGDRGKVGDIVYIANGPGTKVGPKPVKNFAELIKQLDQLAGFSHNTQKPPEGWHDTTESIYGDSSRFASSKNSEDEDSSGSDNAGENVGAKSAHRRAKRSRQSGGQGGGRSSRSQKAQSDEEPAGVVQANFTTGFENEFKAAPIVNKAPVVRAVPANEVSPNSEDREALKNLMRKRFAEVVEKMPKIEARMKAAGLDMDLDKNSLENLKMSDANIAAFQNRTREFRKKLIAEEPGIKPFGAFVDKVIPEMENAISKIDLTKIQTKAELVQALQPLKSIVDSHQDIVSEKEAEKIIESVDVEVLMAFVLATVQEVAVLGLRYVQNNQQDAERIMRLIQSENWL